MKDIAIRSEKESADHNLIFTVSCAITFVVGLSGLVGWILDIPILKSLLPNYVAMKANTAIGLICASSSLWFIGKGKLGSFGYKLGLCLSYFVILLGAATLVQYIFNINLGIDCLLFYEASKAIGTSNPGRMAPQTAINFLLAGLCLILIDRQTKSGNRPAQYFALLLAIAPIEALIAYSYGVKDLLGVGDYLMVTQMAVHVAISWLFLSLGILMARPNVGLMKIVMSDSYAGFSARRLLIPGVMLPLIVGYLVSRGAALQLYDPYFGYSVIVLTLIFLFGFLVWRNAHGLNRLEREREAIQLESAKHETHVKFLQEAVAAKNERDQFFNVSLDMLCIAGTDGYFKRLNPSFEKVLGFSVEELCAKPLFDFIHPDDVAPTIEQIKIQADGRSVMAFENRYVCKDGSYKWLSWKSTPSGNLMYAAARDITEAKKMEAQLIEARESALAAARAKAEFLANMSHEIRTPLNGVIGMTDLMLETSLNDQQRRYAKIVQESGHGLLSIINDILDFSKIEAGKLELETVEFSPGTVTESQIELLASKAREKQISVMTFIDPAIPTLVKGDPGRVAQVILNLVSNAIKFTEKGSVVVRSAIEFESSFDLILRFSIEDTGAGISEDNQMRLFQPFTQADGSTSRHYGGTGLGLSISKRLVGLMGGKIGLKSKEGIGSTFWFTVPVQKTTVVESINKILPAGLNILIVDDDPPAGEIISKYLQAWNIKTSIATRGKEALVILDRDDSVFDLAIIDKKMPDMNGLELAMHIKTSANFGKLRLILATSFLEVSLAESARSIGFSGVLTKPIRRSDLYDSIANALSSESTIQEELLKVHIVKTPVKMERGRILVAEDNAVNQLLVTTILKNLGFYFHAVRNGHEAIEAFQSGHYDVILMDCQMPGLDGFEATRAIRKLETNSGHRVPIVAVTANAMNEDRIECLDSGMDDHISKPLKKEALAKILDKWLNSAQKGTG